MRLAFFEDRIDSPIGELRVLADDAGCLRAIDWGAHDDRLRQRLRARYGDSFTVERRRDPHGHCTALERYFAGDLAAIAELPVAATGTPFQRAVWSALREIPCGTTTSYGAIARRIGRPNATRAVGLANNANPIGIVVPCHRVIGSDGSLTGYGGGLDSKRWLLRHERALLV